MRATVPHQGGWANPLPEAHNPEAGSVGAWAQAGDRGKQRGLFWTKCLVHMSCYCNHAMPLHTQIFSDIYWYVSGYFLPLLGTLQICTTLKPLDTFVIDGSHLTLPQLQLHCAHIALWCFTITILLYCYLILMLCQRYEHCALSKIWLRERCSLLHSGRM